MWLLSLLCKYVKIYCNTFRKKKEGGSVKYCTEFGPSVWKSIDSSDSLQMSCGDLESMLHYMLCLEGGTYGSQRTRKGKERPVKNYIQPDGFHSFADPDTAWNICHYNESAAKLCNVYT